MFQTLNTCYHLTASVLLRYELRMRYLPKGYLSHFSEDKPSLNYLYHQVRQHQLLVTELRS